MNSSFYTAITGAKSHQIAINGTAHNIANINTAGYKASITEFSTLYERFLSLNPKSVASDHPTGVRVGATAIDTRAGIYSQTDSTFDVAIDGNGWFGVVGRNALDAKQVAYTRNGSFVLDRDSNLVNQNGNYVLGSTYGNLVEKNGGWEIDPAKAAGGLLPLDKQSQLFIPQNLTYPAVATTSAEVLGVLNGGMPSSAANEDSSIRSLYDQNGKYIGANGKSVVVVAGSEAFSRLDGESVLTKNIAFLTANQLAFELNGEQFAVEFEPSDTASSKAAKIAEAINSSSVATATSDGSKLAIRSKEIEIRSNSNFFAHSMAKEIQLDETNRLGEYKEKLETIIKSRYPSAKVALLGDGSIEVINGSHMNISFFSGDGQESGFVNAMQSATENTKLLTQPLFERLKSTSQTIITSDGEKQRLKTNIKEVAPQSATSGKQYEISSTIHKSENAAISSNLKDLVVSSKPLDLNGGESFYFAFGKTPVVTDGGVGYSFDIAGFEPATDPSISFNINGKTISHSAAAGVSAMQFRLDLINQIRSNGYEVATSGNAIIIIGDDIKITEPATNIPNSGLSRFAMKKITYQDGKTVANLLNELQETANNFGATLSFDNSQFAITNNTGANIQTTMISTDKSDFGKIVGNLSATTEPNSKIYSSRLQAETTLFRSNANLIGFDSNGEMVGKKTIELDNSGKPMRLDLSLSYINGAKESISTRANGVHKGAFEGYTIGSNGEIIATFDNARSSVIAQLAVFHFANDQGLMRIGDTMFMESDNSGKPHFWLDDENKKLLGATVNGKMLEGSNVQAPIALTDLIVYQRAYEGNAKSITTSDELIKNAINMKR